MTILEKAKAHLATYGAAHTECCGTPIVRALVGEVERLDAENARFRQGLFGGNVTRPLEDVINSANPREEK